MIKSLEHGKWYIVVNCAYCGEVIPMQKRRLPELTHISDIKR
jgi:hypothetical protein